MRVGLRLYYLDDSRVASLQLSDHEGGYGNP